MVGVGCFGVSNSGGERGMGLLLIGLGGGCVGGWIGLFCY